MGKKNDIRIDTNKIHPLLKLYLDRMIKYANKEGIYIIVTEGFRTVEQQNALYAKGRTKPGPVVTNATGNSYTSQHQWGVAIDICIANEGHMWDTAYFKRVAEVAKKHCKHLGWGGDWTKEVDGIVDTPHFYIDFWGKNPFPLKEKYGTPGAFMCTWTGNVNMIGKGLWLWDSYKKGRKKVVKMPRRSKVKVLKRGKKWATVEYQGIVGYARNRYIK